MAWIRRVRTASGATAVQIAEYDGGQRKIVAHVGSAHTEAELGILLERAREMLADPAQGSFDLGIEPAAPQVRLVAPAAAPALFEAEPLLPGPRRRGRRGWCRPTRGCCSRRWTASSGIWGSVPWATMCSGTWSWPGSWSRPRSWTPGRVLAELGRKAASDKTMRRTLARCADRGYRDKIAGLCFAHVLASGDISLVLMT